MKHLYKTSLLLLIWIVSVLQVDAAPISRQQALQNAQVFLENKGRNDAAPTLSLVTSKSLNTSQEKYYVFNIGNKDGYVIAAGDDCAPAILGYADTGYIDLDSMPVNLQSWLEEYAQQIQYMRDNGYSPSKEPKLTSNYSAISPLLTTTWDQEDPYNQNCPDFFSYGKCVTGCVATAMAQVMYYHRANSVAQTTAQIPAYDCRTLWLNGSDTLGHIHVDAIPAGSPIDWNNMLDSYSGSTTATQKQAVANLMKYCGASVRMNYANAWSGGSGAYSSDVPIALKSYFNYSDETTLQYRSNYSSDAAWESLVYTELSSSRPVYYSGSNSSGGHAFVCDGYDGSGYYHINWGWSGTSDGYFLLTALDPDQQGTGGSSSGYNQNQAALINAQPKSSSPSNPVLATSISLNNTSAELNTGETLQLTATVLPSNATNKTVTWTTSNSSVATVNSNGLVTAKSPGTATIIAMTTDGTNLSASCSVTVIQNVVLATSISLNKTSAELTEGYTIQLTATVLPSNATNKAVTWTTSNSSVATVSSNGLVIANNPGAAIITARTTDGSNLSASCSVTVKQDAVLATSISLNKTSAEINTGGTLQLTATVLPSNTTNKTVTWSTSNSSVATVSYGLVSAKTAGTATITAMTTDGSDLRATCIINVINSDNLATGEWAWLPTGEPAIVGQTTNDHLFVRNTYNDEGTTLSYDNVVSFKSGKVQTVWFWLDDDEIYLNNKVQALTPMALNSAGELYKEITYNSLQCELYLPMSMRMIMTENEDGDEVAFLQGDRMPNTTDFSFSETAETKVVDGKEYRVYRIVLSNLESYGGHFSSKDASMYKANGALKKDDAPLFGIFIKNENQIQSEGRIGDMIIANIDYGICECIAAGWEPNDYRFIYGTGGNNESQRFQLYNRIALYGSAGIDADVLATSISLNKTSAELIEGNTMQLTATVLPSNATNKTVTWTTSNSSVATVNSNGLVTAKSPGNATITATTTDGSNLSASCSVTVKQNVVLATSISLNKTSAELTEGYTMQLTATVLPSNATNKAVTWTTSYSSVATVSSNGLVTAKSPGNATITATTTDGSNLSASCSVTVKQDAVLATSISLNKTSAEINTGGTLQLTATVLPSNTTNKTVTWSTSNGSVATVSSNGLVTAKTVGTATITAMTTDGSNLSATCLVTVKQTNPQSSIISFADANVKAICVQNWDTNGDGELSEDEAAAVTSLNDVFKGKSITSFDELQCFTGLTIIDDDAFSGCGVLTSVTIPNTVIIIGNHAFDGTFGLADITIPNSVTTIGIGAFSDCYNLTSLTIPNSVITIGDDAFHNCHNLASLTIPNSVITIGNSAFRYCSHLSSLVISKSVTSIGKYAFAWCNLTNIIVENGNPNYDSRNNCNAIIETATNTLITGSNNTFIPNSVTAIGNNAFELRGGLTNIAIPNSVISIGERAFSECYSLANVTIGNSVASIGDYAFNNCSSLANVTIGNSVDTIGDYAFRACEALTSIIIPTSVAKVGKGLFMRCKGLESITVDSENPIYDSRNNCNAIIEKSSNTLLIGCKNTVIPNTVTAIGELAFYAISELTSITIPNSVTAIGDEAFEKCDGLTSVTIGSSVTSIGMGAFASIDYLKDVYSYIMNPSNVSFGNFAFFSETGTLHVPAGLASAYRNSTWGTIFDNIVEMDPILAVSISLDKTSVELVKGNTMQLTATVLPSNATNKAVTWTTSNSSVATVSSNGLVTAKSPGNATITATTTDGSNLSASCSVTVKQNVVLATSISLNKTSAELTEGYSMQLSATVLPSNATNKAVTWTTSNSSVATVSSNGLVTAKSPGNATITATTTDGSNLSASCSVTVKQNVVLATSISLNKTSAELTEGNTMQLTSTVLPSNATNKTVTWTTSNSSIATVSSNGVVTAISPGTATITASTTDGTNLSASCVVTVISNQVNYDNYLSMDNVEAIHGDTVVIPVKMTNAASIISFQTDIFLPDGLELMQEDGEYLIDPSGRMTRTHSLTSNAISNGAVRVICYSSNYKPFTGNSGDDLFYITVKVADDAEGDYIIRLRNTLFTTSNFEELTAPDAAAIVHVNPYFLGDANGSGTVTVSDVVVTSQYVLEMYPQPFIFEAADVNADGTITVTDVSRIAWMVLNPTLRAPLRAPAIYNNGDRMRGSDITLTAGETRRVSIMLDNEMDYSAFQLDLNLPAGLRASNFQLTDRAGSHVFDVNTIQNGDIRALCYSPAMIGINGHEGALLTFDVTAATPITADIMVDGIELVTTACQTVKLDAFTISVNNASSINEVAAGKTIAKVEYFNLAGQQITEPVDGVTLIVTTYTDGTRSTNKVIR